MYTCERCGTRFGRVTASESCPRCLARDGVRVALSSRSSEESAARTARDSGGGLLLGRAPGGSTDLSDEVRDAA
jgi:hypothetical protein